jgi:hypothetical protein
VTDHVTLRLHTGGIYLIDYVTSEGNWVHQILCWGFIAKGRGFIAKGRGFIAKGDTVIVCITFQFIYFLNSLKQVIFLFHFTNLDYFVYVHYIYKYKYKYI